MSFPFARRAMTKRDAIVATVAVITAMVLFFMIQSLNSGIVCVGMGQVLKRRGAWPMRGVLCLAEVTLKLGALVQHEWGCSNNYEGLGRNKNGVRVHHGFDVVKTTATCRARPTRSGHNGPQQFSRSMQPHHEQDFCLPCSCRSMLLADPLVKTVYEESLTH
eukprot:4045599-Amphidinium_carterae.1